MQTASWLVGLQLFRTDDDEFGLNGWAAIFIYVVILVFAVNLVALGVHMNWLQLVTQVKFNLCPLRDHLFKYNR